MRERLSQRATLRPVACGFLDLRLESQRVFCINAYYYYFYFAACVCICVCLRTARPDGSTTTEATATVRQCTMHLALLSVGKQVLDKNSTIQAWLLLYTYMYICMYMYM